MIKSREKVVGHNREKVVRVLRKNSVRKSEIK